jgi:sulfur carrier protein ThiS
MARPGRLSGCDDAGMNITLKLYAGLTDFLPLQVRTANQMPLELAKGTSIERAIEPLGLPAKMVHLVLVNGVYASPEQRPSFVLKDGDVLAIWPPIAGG